MYKLIIVDDEKEVRDGFRQFVDWNALGFQLVACFEDGKEAIEFLNKNNVDVVLTDIDMVNVNGIELSGYIYNNCPNTKTVLVSGHKDFEFAKQALEYNVVKYLIKPTDLTEIRTLFEEIKNELEVEAEQQKEVVKYKQKYENILPLLKEQFLLNIISGSLQGEEELKMRLSAINLPDKYAHSNCCMVTVNLSGSIQGKSINYVISTLQNFFHQEREGVNYISVPRGEHDLLILALSFSTSEYTLSKVENDISIIRTTMEKNFGIILSYEESSIYPNLLELSKSISTSTIGTTMNQIDTTTALGIKDYREFIQQYKLFIPLILNGKRDLLEEKLHSIMSELEPLPIQDIQKLMIDLISMITQTIVEMGVNVLEIRNFAYHGILSIDNFDDIIEFCNDCLHQFVSNYESNKIDTSTDIIIDKAKDYINQYYDRDISLEDVADYVFLNHAYFSRLFKQQTGRNFSDYLTTVRIDNAIKLLKENKYKTYEISEKIGYKSSKYFARVFKKTTGLTPKEYYRHYLNVRSFVND
jgi:two-component system response regulator YesN